jgi:molybdopterin converting factor small subunit
MTVKIHLFGPQALSAGSRQLLLDVGDNATCADLKQRIAQAVPDLVPSLPSSRIAINHEFADDDQAICDSDELALIGMVSGG